MTEQFDAEYLDIILRRLNICKQYRPKFGQGGHDGLSLTEFSSLYGADSFYSWFGLDNPLMYAAHRAAGGITSIYRQIGIGCEEVFRRIIQDQLGVSETAATRIYQVETSSELKRQLSLDARIELEAVKDSAQKRLVTDWLASAASYLSVAPEVSHVLKGAVFEVRQGYKSKDSKRQNADIANAAYAYSQGYLPVVAILSTQIDGDVARRYESAKGLLLRGYISELPIHSTYAFSKQILGYDLAGFFERNSETLKAAILDILKTLLEAHD